MDHDNFSSDDFLGEATVNETDLISIGMERGTSHLNATKYSVATGTTRITASSELASRSPPQSARLKKMEEMLEAGGTAFRSRCHGVQVASFGSVSVGCCRCEASYAKDGLM